MIKPTFPRNLKIVDHPDVFPKSGTPHEHWDRGPDNVRLRFRNREVDEG